MRCREMTASVVRWVGVAGLTICRIVDWVLGEGRERCWCCFRLSLHNVKTRSWGDGAR